MNKIDGKILDINKVICGNIARFDDSERGLLSQNILSQLRNFVEHISLKALAASRGQDIENTYDNIQDALVYIKTRGDLRFLTKFHKLLQITASHYTLDEENSERLMLKYYEYLLKIRSHLKAAYNLDVLENIDSFPINTDTTMEEYYEKIVEKIKQPESARSRSTYNDRYYIQKVKPFFVEHEVYYEVTFTTANDFASKFDRIIAFTKFDIPHNYAVKLSISNDNIQILGKNMPIQIIDYWEVSIRPCEFNNFADIFGDHAKIQTSLNEYGKLMSFLTQTGLSLVELINFTDSYYQNIKFRVTQGMKVSHIFSILDKCRDITAANAPGSNVVKYLLHNLYNKTIKLQYRYGGCEHLSGLHLEYGCIPFDKMPFNTSLIKHNPKISDLFESLDSNNREHELFARLIKNNTETRGQIYTPKKNITGFEDIDTLMRIYNSKLYYTHTHRKLENYNDHIYIKGYQDDTSHIIEKLKELSSSGIKNYASSVDSWLQTPAHGVDCDQKKDVLRNMFENSKVALIYGPAGTGKSTIINHISNFFNDYRKLYLANTNPAVDNLKRRVKAAGCTIKTIAKFLSPRNDDVEFDILIIDECSTVSNSDMRKVLRKATFRYLVLVGDVYQIESILFGNWFNIGRSFVPTTSVFELTKPYRTNNPKLLDLWGRVRDIDDNILEHIARNNYSVSLDDSFFVSTEEDEIILCLNYDGLYGINNINRFLQSNNENDPVQWTAHTYKIGDPILFNESERFAPLIYNNLKGRIVGIEKFDNRIQFDIELDRAINELDAIGYDFQLMDNSNNGNSIIRFFVNKHRSTDEDDDSSSDAVAPFQVAYAVSIHKAQGLEYKSVKIVITNEVEEMITHNIFYTAITRAREKLKIYWTPETEKKVLSSLEIRNNRKDVELLKLKFDF